MRELPRPPAPGARRLKSLPTYAILLGFLLVLGMIGSLNVEIPGTFPNRGGAAPRADMPPRCLALAHAPPGDFAWMPDTVRLTPVVYARTEHGTWYRAPNRGKPFTGWRPAGADSIDISGHHGPVLRLPARGAHRVGRGGWPVYVHVWDALTSRDWRVEARETACATS
ncbi:MAG TPA: hypothetical protein VEX86_03050 [Longimicrobium sp.]|nr:hypothetical protein [Longimicrobium sp.]